jgi:hypothetical protein
MTCNIFPSPLPEMRSRSCLREGSHESRDKVSKRANELSIDIQSAEGDQLLLGAFFRNDAAQNCQLSLNSGTKSCAKC